jgi:hypothetical protein
MQNPTAFSSGKKSVDICEANNHQINGRLFCRDWIFVLFCSHEQVQGVYVYSKDLTARLDFADIAQC